MGHEVGQKKKKEKDKSQDATKAPNALTSSNAEGATYHTSEPTPGNLLDNRKGHRRAQLLAETLEGDVCPSLSRHKYESSTNISDAIYTTCPVRPTPLPSSFTSYLHHTS